MRRREVIVGLLGFPALNAWLPAVAQARRTARIGVLLQVPRETAAVRPLWRALVEGLREHGWEEGRNLTIEGRFAGGDPARFPALAAELVALNVDAILAANLQSVDVVRRQTSTIPIVMLGAGDPLQAGLVTSLARPTGNITGLGNEPLAGKQIELLTELKPGLERVARIYDPTYPGAAAPEPYLEVASRLGVTVQLVPVTAPDDIREAFMAIARAKPQALHVFPTPIVQAHRFEIAAFAIEQRLPTITSLKVFVPDGILMSYAPDPAAAFRRGAWYVDRILRGAKPADLPIEQMSKFELVINLKTARAIGLEIPAGVLDRADEVID